MYDAKQQAELRRIEFEKTKAEADAQVDIITAEAGIKVAQHEARQVEERARGDATRIRMLAEAEATQTTQIGDAEAEVIRAKGEAQAKAYHDQVNALTAQGVTTVEIMKAIAGAGLAFLWFNTHPAQVFMGDVGALALGAALGTIAVIVRQEIVLAIMGGIFVVEALSVMAQVSYFKYTKRNYGEGRRILKMAPLHHHFEKSGWKETQVVVRFWIITMLLCLIGLSTLKLR